MLWIESVVVITCFIEIIIFNVRASLVKLFQDCSHSRGVYAMLIGLLTFGHFTMLLIKYYLLQVNRLDKYIVFTVHFQFGKKS